MRQDLMELDEVFTHVWTLHVQVVMRQDLVELDEVFAHLWTLHVQVVMRQDLMELEELCSEVQGLQRSAKASYEQVLAYFGETTNSTPSGNRFCMLFSMFTVCLLPGVASLRRMILHA